MIPLSHNAKIGLLLVGICAIVGLVLYLRSPPPPGGSQNGGSQNDGNCGSQNGGSQLSSRIGTYSVSEECIKDPRYKTNGETMKQMFIKMQDSTFISGFAEWIDSNSTSLLSSAAKNPRSYVVDSSNLSHYGRGLNRNDVELILLHFDEYYKTKDIQSSSYVKPTCALFDASGKLTKTYFYGFAVGSENNPSGSPPPCCISQPPSQSKYTWITLTK
jgi:hypothetical protein